MLRPKKIHTRNLLTQNIPAARKFLSPPITFLMVPPLLPLTPAQLTGYKTKLRRKGDFFVYSNMVSEISIKDNQIVTSKENGQTGGAGGREGGGRRL